MSSPPMRCSSSPMQCGMAARQGMPCDVGYRRGSRLEHLLLQGLSEGYHLTGVTHWFAEPPWRHAPSPATRTAAAATTGLQCDIAAVDATPSSRARRGLSPGRRSQGQPAWLMSTHWLGMPAWRHGTVSVESHAPQRVAPSSCAIQRARTMPPTPLVAPVARPRVDRRRANPQPPCTLGMWCRSLAPSDAVDRRCASPPRVAHDEPVPRERVRERVVRVEGRGRRERG